MRPLFFLFLPSLSTAQDLGPIPNSVLIQPSMSQVASPEYTSTVTTDDGASTITLPVLDRDPSRVRCAHGTLAEAVHIDAQGQTVAEGLWSMRQFLADRDAPVSSLLPHVQRGPNRFDHFLLLAMARDGSLPQAGSVCGLLLQVHPADLDGSIPWDQLPEVPSGELRALVFRSDTPIHFVIEQLDAVANADPEATYAIALSDEVTPWPGHADTTTATTAPTSSPTDTAAVLLHRGAPFAAFDGPDRIIDLQGNPLAVRDGGVVSTPTIRSTDTTPFNDLWDSRFIVERSFTTHPDQDIVTTVTDPPVWSWSGPVSRDQDVMGALVAQQRNLRLSSLFGPEVWENGTLLGMKRPVAPDQPFTYGPRRAIGSWGSDAVNIDGTVLPFASHTSVVDEALHCRLSPEGPWTTTVHRGRVSAASDEIVIDALFYRDGRPRRGPPVPVAPSVDRPQMRALCLAVAAELAANSQPPGASP